MNQALTIHHPLGDIIVNLHQRVNRNELKKLISSTMDLYQEEQNISASQVHAGARVRHGDRYQTAGYYLRLYRLRADLTQARLAERADIHQHHLSEMEHNRRPIGKAMAKKLAAILDCDYQKLL